MKSILLFIIISGCSSLSKSSPKLGKETFSYQDISGTYRLMRETKIINKKLVSRIQLFSSGGEQKLVEKSIVVSQMGSVKSKNGRSLVVRPLASEFSVWLEGKLYSSKQNLNTVAKSMKVTTKSPEEKSNGTRDVRVPKGRFFCYYSQVPECLHQGHLLEQAVGEPSRTHDFHLVWDSFPYTTEQLSNMSGVLFAPATVKYDGLVKDRHRFEVEVEGQVILYYFSKSFDFVKMSWIAQGLTISSPGEEVEETE